MDARSPAATIQRALTAIVAAQSADGAFRDFALGMGESGAWVTAHVALRLATLPPRYREPAVTAAVARAARYLDGVPWSYNERVPPDADSLAHALLLFTALGERRPDAARALAGHRMPDGGFATFLPGTPGADYPSWTRSHPDVTPVALRALLPYEVLPAPAAEPHAFWWDLDYYTPAMWLALGHPPAPVTAPPRSLLDAAYAFAIVRAAADHAHVDALGDRLLAALGPLAPPSRVLRVTHPDVVAPWATEHAGELHADVRGVYSTAVIASELAAWWR